MKIKSIVLIAFICCFFSHIHAETKDEYRTNKHEVRFMLGDMFCETLMWHDDVHGNYKGQLGPSGWAIERQKCRWTPHFGLEYGYRFTKNVSLLFLTDYQYTSFHKVSYDNNNQVVSDKKEYFYNLSFVPKIRFTYLHRKYVNLYSGLGVGLNINSGSEYDIHGKQTALAPVFDFTFIGVKVGKGHWYGSIDFGGAISMKNQNTIYMLMARSLSLGVGYTFN
ncbi:MAG: porin family protein [Bacteroidales bacterium]|nr:porin family protein [Bacteroidales bacterium]